MQRGKLIFVVAAMSLLGAANGASAQLLAAKDGPVVYGHHHLSTANIEAQKKFFVTRSAARPLSSAPTTPRSSSSRTC